MTRRHLLARVVLIGVVLTAGCGVRPSGVITGGPAPTRPAEGAALYFLAKSSLTPALRPTRQPLSPTQTLALLETILADPKCLRRAESPEIVKDAYDTLLNS